MEVNGQLYVLTALERVAGTNWIEGGWIPELVLTLWNIKKFLDPAGNRTPAFQSLARRYND
jgi:hypothetical protein